MYLETLLICLALTALVPGWYAYAQRRDTRRRMRLRTAVLVNGTRGKSSTTRLIAAGLRADARTPDAGGFGPVLGKTTGTSARWILPDGAEQPIARSGSANIKEMAVGLALAERLGATAYVAECMAIRPEYQAVVERYWMRADITVITNIRADHQEVVGQGEEAMAASLAAGLPLKGRLVAHAKTLALLNKVTAFPQDRTVVVDPDYGKEWLGLFTEPVMPENLSLALTVCSLLGVPPETAAPAMATAQTDPGNLEISNISFDGRSLSFVGAFAANDPESTLLLAQHYAGPDKRMLGLWMHGRADRRQRSIALHRSLRILHPDFLILSGDTAFLRRLWRRDAGAYGLFALPLAGHGELAAALAALPPGDIRLLGMGNAKGLIHQVLGEHTLCQKLSSA